MKTKRNWLASITLFVLLASLASPLIASQTSAIEDGEDDAVRIIRDTSWYRLESDIITVLFPAGGQKPMFIWWYTNEPDQVYVVKFQGLIEWLAIEHSSLPNPDYYSNLRNASSDIWSRYFDDWYFKPMEQQYMMNWQMRMMLLSMVQEMMQQMNLTWHMPFLDFRAAQWSLSDVHNITASDGKIIGVAFAFTLVETPQPRFQFAENNIMIRIRFYNTTVQETVPGTSSSYTVNAGEMKMDLVINKWIWNLDSIKALVTKLQSEGFNISIPNMKSRLALWVNLASINITRMPLPEAEDQPEGIEDHSTSTVMEVDEHRESMSMTSTQEEAIETSNPIVRIQFANQTETLAGFFRFVAQAKVTDYPNQGDVNMVPVKAAFRPAGAHMKLFLGYPYFGNGTLEHDPSIGVDAASVDTTPKYAVQAPSGSDITPVVIGAYIPPLFSSPLMLALIVVISATATMLYAIKWKRKTPVNMVGVGK